jgi:hypothetical protein
MKNLGTSFFIFNLLTSSRNAITVFKIQINVATLSRLHNGAAKHFTNILTTSYSAFMSEVASFIEGL